MKYPIVEEIRIGLPQSEDYVKEICATWKNDISSGYVKKKFDGEVTIGEMGPEGNLCGHPMHLQFLSSRAILIYNERTYESLREKFPKSAKTLVRGGFGENFIVSDPSLLPEIVCIGDKFRIGSCELEISGPRCPCPKVDMWHNETGLTQYCKETGYSGYFARVLKPGKCSSGDELILIDRPNPGITICEVSSLLWGEKDKLFTARLAGMNMNKLSLDEKAVLNDRKSILLKLMSIEAFITRHYRDLAGTKYERILQSESSDVNQDSNYLLFLVLVLAALAI